MSKKQAVKKKPANGPVKKSNRGCKGIDESELIRRIYFGNPPKGLNNKQMAEWLGISDASFYNILKDNIDFLEAVKFYTGESHLEVLKSFKKIACGFNFDETEKVLKKNKETGQYELVVTKVVTKHVAPNATAGIFYLKNKMPDHFKDKIETEHSIAQGALDNITFIIKGRDNE